MDAISTCIHEWLNGQFSVNYYYLNASTASSLLRPDLVGPPPFPFVQRLCPWSSAITSLCGRCLPSAGFSRAFASTASVYAVSQMCLTSDALFSYSMTSNRFLLELSAHFTGWRRQIKGIDLPQPVQIIIEITLNSQSVNWVLPLTGNLAIKLFTNQINHCGCRILIGLPLGVLGRLVHASITNQIDLCGWILIGLPLGVLGPALDCSAHPAVSETCLSICMYTCTNAVFACIPAQISYGIAVLASQCTLGCVPSHLCTRSLLPSVRPVLGSTRRAEL